MLNITKQDETAILQIARPKVNAINREMVATLLEGLTKLEKDPSVRGIILTGLPGVFSGGLDVIDLYPRNRIYMTEFWQEFTTLLYRLFTCPKLIFSAITGHSPAGGTVFVIMTDYRVMGAGDYKIGLNEVAVGLVLPNSIGTVYQYLLGRRQAEMMAATGKLVSPEEALKVGLVDEVCSAGSEVNHAMAKLREWYKLPREQQIITKLQMRRPIIEIFKKSQAGDVTKMVDIWFESSFQKVMGGLVAKLISK